MNKLQLYRNILRHAKRFPSKKRDKIVDEIKTTFRANSFETDVDKIRLQLSVASKGLEQLMMYTTLPKSSSSWTINLEKEPMPSNKPLQS
jgi:ribosomal protein S25